MRTKEEVHVVGEEEGGRGKDLRVSGEVFVPVPALPGTSRVPVKGSEAASLGQL